MTQFIAIPKVCFGSNDFDCLAWYVVCNWRKTGWSNLFAIGGDGNTEFPWLKFAAALCETYSWVYLAGAGTGDRSAYRNRALTMSFNSATSGDTPEVEVLVLTLAIMALLRENNNSILVSLGGILEQFCHSTIISHRDYGKFDKIRRYVVDVEPIPPRNRNNKEVHLDYLKHLKESVETLREIVEKAKVERPIDSSLAFACLYTKHSQELLEYVIGTCLKDFNQRDKNHAATPLTRKKLLLWRTNVKRVNSCTDASGSQPRSNTKKNRILPAKRVNKKQVEEHPRTNKSSLKTTNRVDSSISSKRTVVQIVLWVYYVEGLGHNLFSVRQFCDSGLEVTFKKHSCYVSDIDGVELIKVSRTPQQNGVVERRNRTLVEAARKMLIFSKAPMFLWAEVVATACYAQNRSLIYTRHNKTPYEMVHDKKPDLTFFRVFGALCYPTNDSGDLGKLQPTADIGIFVGYAPSRKGYRIYNKRTRRIMETIHIQFDELSEPIAPVQLSTGPAHTFLTPGQIKPPRVKRLVSPAPVVPVPINSATPSSTTIDQDASSPSHLPSSSALQSLSSYQGVAAGSTIIEDNPFAPVDNNPFINVFASEPSFEASSSEDVSSPASTHVTQPHHQLGKWSKDHSLDNVIGNPSQPVSTKKQLATDALWCLYNSVMSKVKPKNFKSAITKDRWFQAMQDEIHEFGQL
ncbi:retrovirus-related pol polyprotein from transposon TNT 1-94 [Tanacetum coccineum]